MRYIVRKSVVEVVGEIWWPKGPLFGTTITLRPYDVENARDDDGKITRESVDRWLSMHAGDFSSIHDFSASVEDGDETVDIPWQTEAGELAFCDTLAEA